MSNARVRLLVPLLAVLLAASASPTLAGATPSPASPGTAAGAGGAETAAPKKKQGKLKVVIRAPKGVPATITLRGSVRRTLAKPVAGKRAVVRFKSSPGRVRVVAPTVLRGGRLYQAVATPAKVKVRSARTTKVSVTYRAVTKAPRALALTGLTSSRVSLDWQGLGGTSVRLVRTVGTKPASKPAQGLRIPVTGTTAVDAGLKAGKSYTYALFGRLGKQWVGPVSLSVGTLPAADAETSSSFLTSPDTRILTKDQIAWATYLPSGALFRLNGATPVIGTIIGAPATSSLPQGFLGRITRIRPDGVAVAAPVGLGDAFDYLQVRSTPDPTRPTQELPDEGGPEEAPPGPQALVGKAPISGTGQLARPPASCRGGSNWSVAFDPNFELDGDFNGTLVKQKLPFLPDVPKGAHLEGSASVAISGAASIESQGSFVCGLDLPRYSTQLTVLPIPINFTFEAAAEVSASAAVKVYNVGAAASAGFWYEAQFGVGLDNYADGDVFKSAEILQPHMSGAFGVDVVVSGEVIIGPGGGSNPVGAVAGVRGTLEVLNASATGYEVVKDGDPEPERCVKADVTGKLAADVVAKAWVPGWEEEVNLDIPGLTKEWSYKGRPLWFPRNCVDPRTNDVYILEIESEGDDGDVLEGALGALGYNVDRGPAMPANPDRYGQIWAVTTYIGYPEEIITGLSDYVNLGGAVMINSEHGCCEVTNDDVTQFLNSVIVADVAAITDCITACERSTDQLNPTARGDIANTPNAGVSVLTDALGYYTGVPPANQLLVVGDQVSATAWAEEDTRLGKGRVVTIADSNWSDRSNFTGTNEEFLENVAHYLSRQ